MKTRHLRYTCDRSRGNSAATGDRADAARPSRSAAPTALRSAEQVLGGGEHEGLSGVAKLAMNVMLLTKPSKIRWFLLMMANFGRYAETA